VDDLYFEAHWAQKLSEQIQLVLGVDYLYGKAKAESELFDYFVPLSGKGAQSSSSVVHDEETATEDERNFSGLFAQLEWRPTERFLLEVGVRENHTQEKRDAEAHPLGEPEDGEEEGGEASRTTTRASGYIGASYQLWSNDHDGLWVFGDYRDTYKPPAIDFGPEAEGDLLKPETATSYELGLKGRNLGGRLSWQISGFQMDFENLVVSQIVNGSPGLINAGTERFKGIEAEINVELPYDLRLQLAGAYHDAKFKRFTQLFDGEPTALDGKRLELSANDLAALGLTYAPSSGFRGSVEVSYVGDRYLNKRNTALSPSFTTYGASVGYDFGIGELRLEGRNLSDERDPVIESELGDAQYYRLPARSFRLVWSGKF
nr:TonB-dependent receptor [Thermoanaerobaculia bacterium]